MMGTAQKEKAESILQEINSLTEVYRTLNRELDEVYSSISENWQGHCAARLTAGFEGSRSESDSVIRLLIGAGSSMEQSAAKIELMNAEILEEQGE